MTQPNTRGKKSRQLGITGEQLAHRFLVNKGYRTLTTNYRSPRGEIDLVCQDGDTVVFVEVKTRSSEKFGTPEESVTPLKQRRLQQLAQEYLIAHHLETQPVRFDVLTLLCSPGAIKIEHLIGAF